MAKREAFNYVVAKVRSLSRMRDNKPSINLKDRNAMLLFCMVYSTVQYQGGQGRVRRSRVRVVFSIVKTSFMHNMLQCRSIRSVLL